jgi:hypothetical protein
MADAHTKQAELLLVHVRHTAAALAKLTEMLQEQGLKDAREILDPHLVGLIAEAGMRMHREEKCTQILTKQLSSAGTSIFGQSFLKRCQDEAQKANERSRTDDIICPCDSCTAARTEAVKLAEGICAKALAGGGGP